jgi:hypothetical protein
MSDDAGGLANFGIRVISFFSGVAGGTVGAWVDDKMSFRAWALCALCGGLTANFLAVDVMHFFPSWVSEGGIGFALGSCSFVVVKKLRIAAEKGKLSINLGDRGEG